MNIRIAHIHYLMKGADTLSRRQHPSNTISLITLDLFAIEAVSISFFVSLVPSSLLFSLLFVYIRSKTRVSGSWAMWADGWISSMETLINSQTWIFFRSIIGQMESNWKQTNSNRPEIAWDFPFLSFIYSRSHLNAICWALFVQHWNINIMFVACDSRKVYHRPKVPEGKTNAHFVVFVKLKRFSWRLSSNAFAGNARIIAQSLKSA